MKSESNYTEKRSIRDTVKWSTITYSNQKKTIFDLG